MRMETGLVGMLTEYFLDWWLVGGVWVIALSFYWQIKLAWVDYSAEIELAAVAATIQKEELESVPFWQLRERRQVKKMRDELLTAEEVARLNRYRAAAYAWSTAFVGSLFVALATSAPLFGKWLGGP